MGAVFSKRGGNGRVGRRHSWAARQNAPVSLYNSFGGSFTCVLHEFGSNHKCRSENYIKQKGTGAIIGLHSNWVGEVILACARPTDRIIKDHRLLQQFHSQNIAAVINLEEPGEHAGCGDGVLPATGFAYNPELFTQDNIAYFSFPWKASNFMDETLALSICQAMDSKLSAGKKVAVHCHSGMGRTGLVIACYFLYSGSYNSPTTAIRAVRADRPGTFKKKSQEHLLAKFHKYIRNLRVIYVPPEERRKNLTHGGTKSYPTLVESMVRQNDLLCGTEKQTLQFVPKIVDWLTRDIMRRTEFDRAKREQIAIIFMTAFTTDLSRSIDDEPVQSAKVRINSGDWSGVEELDTSVLCHLLLEWLYQLQEPIVPDTILTTALGRGDIESAIDELAKCDRCSFATLQCLVCWMFQIVPVQPKSIRRLYSALAHVLLANTTLQNEQRSPLGETDSNPNSLLKNFMKKKSNVFGAFKPTLLEIEFGLLLEAVARFWIKLGVARHEELENKKKQTVNTTGGPSAPSSTLPASLGTLALKLRDRHRIGSFSQPWFRDRASLQYEQYNPEKAMEYKKEMERGSIGGPPMSPKSSAFAEQKQKTSSKEKVKPVPQVGKKKTEAQQEAKKNESVDQKQNPVDPPEKKKAAAQEEKKKVAAQEEKKKAAAQEEKKKAAAQEEKKKAAAQEEKKKAGAKEDKKKAVAQEEKKKGAAQEEKKKAIVQEDKRQSTPDQKKKPMSPETKKKNTSEEKEKGMAHDEKKVVKGKRK